MIPMRFPVAALAPDSIAPGPQSLLAEPWTHDGSDEALGFLLTCWCLSRGLAPLRVACSASEAQPGVQSMPLLSSCSARVTLMAVIDNDTRPIQAFVYTFGFVLMTPQLYINYKVR